MLKIKSNTNEFIIIFSEKIGKKKNAQKISFSLCSVQHPFFFSPPFLLVSASFFFFFFCFCFQPPLLEKFSASFFFFFSAHVCPFFQPKTFLPQPAILFQFSPKHFCFRPRYFFSSAQKSLPICGSAPPAFCFFSSYLSFLPLATTYCPFSSQVFSSKPFSATSCFFI